MPGNWRLYLDECVDARATAALIREGRRCGQQPAVQLAFAAAAGRTLLTHDTDFIAESARFLKAGKHHAGVLLAPDRQDLKWLLRAVRHSLAAWRPEEVTDQVRWLLHPPDE